MDTTSHGRVPVATPRSTDDQSPTPDIPQFLRDLDEFLRSLTWRVDEGPFRASHGSTASASAPVSRPAPTHGLDLSVDRDELGQVIVADLVGAAVGVGSTLHEAMEQWQQFAIEHFEELVAREERLHPRMQRQLTYLRQWFG